jgi:hypothetical protein
MGDIFLLFSSEVRRRKYITYKSRTKEYRKGILADKCVCLLCRVRSEHCCVSDHNFLFSFFLLGARRLFKFLVFFG